MTELVAAALLVFALGGRLGIAADSVPVAIGLTWAALNLCHCAVRPYRRCPNPWCSARKPKAGDGRGNYRLRVDCPVCGGLPYRRIGARLIGRG